MAVVESSMHFLSRDRLYDTEKPYQLKYEPEAGIPATNFKMEKKAPIKITSMRGRESEFSFSENGFRVLKLDHDIPYETFSSREGIRTYLRMVQEKVKTQLGAQKVQIFQYLVRKRDAGFPIATGQKYAFNQPSTIAHVDATAEEALTTWTELNGKIEDLGKKPRCQFVNAWKPLRGPLRDWPLALCDVASVNAEDLVAADQVFEDKVTENMQVHHADGQRWYYLEDQTTEEVLVFRQADPQVGAGLGVPHTSFPNPMAKADDAPRESIEVRMLLTYDE